MSRAGIPETFSHESTALVEASLGLINDYSELKICPDMKILDECVHSAKANRAHTIEMLENIGMGGCTYSDFLFGEMLTVIFVIW
jgi:hypothetical protein